MSWSYDPTLLNTTSASGRLNSVRLLVGDTDTTDQLVQNEEIVFALSQSGDNVYTAAAWVCRVIAAKFSRLVDTELSGALSASYSDKAKHYQLLAVQVETLGKKYSGRALGVSAGGLDIGGAFTINRFDNTEAGVTYIPDNPNGV